MPKIDDTALYILLVVTEAGASGLMDKAPTPSQWQNLRDALEDLNYERQQLQDTGRNLEAATMWMREAKAKLWEASGKILIPGFSWDLKNCAERCPIPWE